MSDMKTTTAFFRRTERLQFLVSRHLWLVAAVTFFCADHARGAESLCFVFVEAEGTNAAYSVHDRNGGTDINGAVRYLDRCVAYASTNFCVHVKAGTNVLFSHVVPLLKACAQRNLASGDLFDGAP